MQQNPHATQKERDTSLEIAIDREVKGFRRNLGMTVVELAKLASLLQSFQAKRDRFCLCFRVPTGTEWLSWRPFIAAMVSKIRLKRWIQFQQRVNGKPNKGDYDDLIPD